MMSYDYATMRPGIFTEEGQGMFLAIRDKAAELTKIAGAVTSGALMSVASGDVWKMLACIDRLGELREIDYGSCAGQHRIFVAVKKG